MKGRPFFTIKLIEGGSLGDRIERSRRRKEADLQCTTLNLPPLRLRTSAATRRRKPQRSSPKLPAPSSLPANTASSIATSNGVLTATFASEDINRPGDCFLGIRTELDYTILARYVVDGDRFQLTAPSLMAGATRGIILQQIELSPMHLPAFHDLYYFRLDLARSARIWQQIQAEQAAIIRWSGAGLDLADATFTLFLADYPAGPARR
jgi:hypothetical protein